VLVDKVEPEEASVSNARQDVPGGREQQEKPQTAGKTKLLPPPPLSAQKKISCCTKADKNHPNQSFGKDR
jgi:hypothetical protein